MNAPNENFGKLGEIGNSNGGVAVAYRTQRHKVTAHRLAERLGLSVAKKFRDPHPLHLRVAETSQSRRPPAAFAGPPQAWDEPYYYRLELHVVQPGHPLVGGHGVAADLLALDTSSPAGRSRKSPLFRAVGLGRSRRTPPTPPTPPAPPAPGQPAAPLRILDATAGLGEDAWLLAAAGCTVTAVERQPVIHALLENALRRAAAVDPEIAGRITLLPIGDAVEILPQLGTRTDSASESPHAATPRFDVVLLDPMFPGSAKRKTTERKPLRVLRMLAGDDPDAADLWSPAMRLARQRVVVKRPLRAPTLVDHPPPAADHRGRGFRFDVYPVFDASPQF